MSVTGGNVTVSTHSCCPEWLSIEVIDQGHGIDKQTLKSIFRPFYSSKGSKGTGLGLSVTQKIVSEHGGDINIESKKDKGSRFAIRLPKCPRLLNIKNFREEM
ncbi:ATP-binding protein [Verrucomicrobiota bacterium]